MRSAAQGPGSYRGPRPVQRGARAFPSLLAVHKDVSAIPPISTLLVRGPANLRPDGPASSRQPFREERRPHLFRRAVCAWGKKTAGSRRTDEGGLRDLVDAGYSSRNGLFRVRCTSQLIVASSLTKGGNRHHELLGGPIPRLRRVLSSGPRAVVIRRDALRNERILADISRHFSPHWMLENRVNQLSFKANARPK